MTAAAGTSSVTGVVLAAGCSSRLGGELPKQVLEFAGEPLVRRAVRTALASRLADVVVVVGYRSDLVQDAFAGLSGSGRSPRTVYNADFAAGQSTSVRRGLAAVAPNATGAMFLPADQPNLSRKLIDRLITAHEEGAAIAMPVAEGQPGAPVLFSRRFFKELDALSGDTGGRTILQSHHTEIQQIRASKRELMDLDTMDDLHRLRELATR